MDKSRPCGAATQGPPAQRAAAHGGGVGVEREWRVSQLLVQRLPEGESMLAWCSAGELLFAAACDAALQEA